MPMVRMAAATGNGRSQIPNPRKEVSESVRVIASNTQLTMPNILLPPVMVGVAERDRFAPHFSEGTVKEDQEASAEKFTGRLSLRL